jgi:SAM-dependent methyltransferase
MPKPLSAEQLQYLEKTTLGHYGDKAQSFWQGTKDHDVSQNYRALLSHFEADVLLDILDFGCGPGRDLKFFTSLGPRPVGLDGSPEFCAMARQYSGCEVLWQDLLGLHLPAAAFDAIFANASLFHIPSQELPRVLRELHASLRPGGILFNSNPRGSDEGWSGERYGHFMEFDVACTYLQAAGFKPLSHYYRPEGLPRDQQPWLAMVSQKY